MPSSWNVLSGNVMDRRLRGGGRPGARRGVLDSAPMRAVTIRDKELSVEDHPDPEPGAGEILVRVRAAGINGADMMQRRGMYPAPPGAPQDIPGLELAGEVVGRGPGAERFSEGDRVMAIVGGGGQAELATVHERQAMPVPHGLNWAEAGGTPEVFTTAHDAVFTQAGLRMGERPPAPGGAGGRGGAPAGARGRGRRRPRGGPARRRGGRARDRDGPPPGGAPRGHHARRPRGP